MRRKLALALALALLVQVIEGIQYQHDELLYTKAIWDELKLPFPFSAFEEDDLVISRARDTVGDLFLDSSLDGPFPNLAELIEEDKRRGRFQPASFDISPIEEVTPLLDAAPVASCKACLALADELWPALRNWTHVAARPVAARDLLSLGEELCEYEVPIRVLSEWILLSARVHRPPEPAGGHPLLAGAGGPGPRRPQLQYYMLSARHRQNARVREIQVVKAACRSLLSGVHADAYARGNEASLMGLVEFDAKPSALLEAAAALQGEYLAALEAAGAPGAAAGEEAEDAAAPPAAQRACHDKHPQCAYWAKRGECKANPNYMVGSPASGWCRAACAACQRPAAAAPPAELDPEAAKELEAKAQALLDRLHGAGCTRTSACRWAEGSDAREDLAAAAGVVPGRASALAQAAIVSGPIKVGRGGGGGGGATAAQADPMVNPLLLQVSRVTAQRPFTQAIVPKTEGGRRGAAPDRAAPAPERALWAELGGRCIYSTAGWWSYELCHGEGATQFHVPAGAQAPEWVISLGRAAGGDWAPRNASNAKLFPDGAAVPFVTAALAGGSQCELTGEGGVDSLTFIYGGGEDDPEVAADLDEILKGGGDEAPRRVAAAGGAPPGAVGDRLPRSATVRYMCSPDGEAHLAVAEPAQCAYVIDVYLPGLCHVPGMAPHVPPEVAAKAKAVWGEVGGGGGGEEEGDGDPYVDPDDLEDEEEAAAAVKGAGAEEEDEYHDEL